MPRRNLLTPAERASLLAFPTADEELIRYYTFSEHDLSAIRQRRGSHNRLGFAVQLCYLRYPGFTLPPDMESPASLLTFVGKQLCIEPDVWPQYAQRSQTRREHVVELQVWLGLTPFSISHYRQFVRELAKLAQQTDRGIVLAETLVEMLRQQLVILPTIYVIERVCSEALTIGTRYVYEALTGPLTDHHRRALDGLLEIREGTKGSGLTWLRQPPVPPKPKYVLTHLERLRTIHELGLPDGLERVIHQNRMMKLSREGRQMTAQHLRDLEPSRRYATLVAVIIDTCATLIDSLFSKAKHNHADRFQKSGKAINDKVRRYSRIGRALLDAKQSGGDPFVAIEAIIPWKEFSDSIAEAEKLAQPEQFDYLALVSDSFSQLRRYTPILLDALNMKAASSARELLAGVEVLRI